jgi:hypothetical protein
MAGVTLEQVWEMTGQLSPPERAVLLERLRVLTRSDEKRVTLESIVARRERLRKAGAFDHITSLANRWARPDLDLSDEELTATIREVSKEWEKDIDELGGKP